MLTEPNSTALSIIHQEKLTVSHGGKESNAKDQMRYPYIGNLLTNLPAYVDWKDTDSVYRGCSEYTASALAGLPSAKAIVGKKDMDVCWGQNDSYDTYKQYYLEPDQLVLNGNSLISLGRISYSNCRENKIVVIKKFPLLADNNEIIGIVSYLMDISGQGLVNVLSQLKNLKIKITPSVIAEAKKYLTNKSLQALSLSKREEECLYYLLRNKTAKEIAKELSISHRTVESYLNNLKDKFNCINKTTLIVKAMELGCMHLIPNSILSEKYIVSDT